MADVSVRPARPEDAELVARVQLATWQAAYADLLPAEVLALPLAQVAAVWLHAVEAPPSPRHRVLVAQDGGEVVGLASSEPAEDGAAELTALLVEPRWGRRGHGSRLLAATVDLWREDGVTTGLHWVFEADRVVLGFLESAGWGLDGTGRGIDLGPRVVPQRRLHTAL